MRSGGGRRRGSSQQWESPVQRLGDRRDEGSPGEKEAEWLKGREAGTEQTSVGGLEMDVPTTDTL